MVAIVFMQVILHHVSSSCQEQKKSRKNKRKINPDSDTDPDPEGALGTEKEKCSVFRVSVFRFQEKKCRGQGQRILSASGSGSVSVSGRHGKRVCGYVGVGDKEVGDREREVFRVSVFRFQVSGKALAQKCWGQGQRILSASGSGSVSVSGRHGKRVCGYVGVGGGES